MNDLVMNAHVNKHKLLFCKSITFIMHSDIREYHTIVLQIHSIIRKIYIPLLEQTLSEKRYFYILQKS